MCELDTSIKCKECGKPMATTQCPVGDGLEVSIYCTNEGCDRFEDEETKILYESDFD